MTQCSAECIWEDICARACTFPISQYFGIPFRQKGRQKKEKRKGRTGENNISWVPVRKKK